MHHFMQRPSSPDPQFSIPIAGDPEERERIRLEQDLSRDLRELSFDPSATSQDYSVEYPRHGGGELQSPAFPSFQHPHHSHEISFDPTPDNAPNDYYSYHSAAADESIAAGGETGSTTNHHASAITYGAGLGYRGGRSQSRSGPNGLGEYDPDRQLYDILNAPRGNMSMFNDSRGQTGLGADTSMTPKPTSRNKKSSNRSEPPAHLTFDPIIVEDTEEVNRALEQGHMPPDSSFRRSEPGSPIHYQSKKPTTKLADVLLTFSPQRHRTAHNKLSRSNGLPSATSTSGGSQFERMARGLAREIEEEQRDAFAGRMPLNDIVNTGRARTSGGKTRVQLPDVTGLTSAIATPDRASANYRDPGTGAHEADVTTVNAAIEELAARLRELEKENGTSRRRVRELELELDVCRAEVVKERTRAKEEIMKSEKARIKERDQFDRKGKGKATGEGIDWEARYHEVVEEKKALEALVETLRSHLARTTAELESHQNLVQSLRDLRHKDALEIEEKCREVEELREEVERLGDEVERLRGVVEEGLKERRRLREAGAALSAVVEEDAADVDEDEGGPVPLSPSPQPPAQRPLSRAAVRPPSRQQEFPRVSSPLVQPSTPLQDEVLAERRRRAHFAARADVQRTEEDVLERQSVRSSSGSSHHSRDHDDRSRSSTPRPDHQQSPDEGRQRPRPSRNKPHNSSFPQIRGDRLERLFFAAPEHDRERCRACHRRKKAKGDGREEELRVDAEWLRQRFATRHGDEERLPPQTVLARVLRELEDDFTHYKSIYIELADQYKVIDAASNSAKRNVLAAHLKEVIDTLEQKGDQIASLYELLRFEDKPLL